MLFEIKIYRDTIPSQAIRACRWAVLSVRCPHHCLDQTLETWIWGPRWFQELLNCAIKAESHNYTACTIVSRW